VKLLCLDVPRPDVAFEQLQPYLLDEVRHGWLLHKKGIIREIYARQDRPGIAIVAECDSVEAAKILLSEFPLAKVGLIDFDVIPLGPFLGWETLPTPASP